MKEETKPPQSSNGNPLRICEERMKGCDERIKEEFPPACPRDPDPSLAGNPAARYNLGGPQVEPTAGAWAFGPRELPHVVPICDVLTLTNEPRMNGQENPFYVPPYPNQKDILDWEIAELAHLAQNRDDPSQTAGSFATPFPGSTTLPPSFVADLQNTTRDPISDFIQLDKPPFGAIFNICTRPQFALENVNQQHLLRGDPERTVVCTGRQLARLFEMETPGLYHRHTLNYLLYERPDFSADARPGISPPRHARVCMALDVAIYSALIAAWYYKWLAPLDRSYRQRPYEYDRNKTFRVLFDDTVGDKGFGDKCARNGPCPSPGTPRHPAYPSGHSTFSAAASEILAYFFPDEAVQLRQLANNIGTARLWAGVHWRSDHVAGQRIGRAVARRVIEQLECDCVPPAAPPLMHVPTHEQSREAAIDLRNQPCYDKKGNPCAKDQLGDQKTTPFEVCPPRGKGQG